MSPPPTPPRPGREPTSERPLAPEDRELVLRVVREVEERLRGEMRETVREMKAEFGEELRRLLHGEREQDRWLRDIDARVSRIAEAHGGLAGELTGRDVARAETKGMGSRSAFISLVIAAITTGITTAVIEAYKPVRPAPTPTHQLP